MSRPQPTHQAGPSRHHPYNSAGPSVPAPAQPNGRKNNRKAPEMRAPPSPPRTQRDSNSPPAGLDAAFGGKEGGKWWDEELPAPPASLSSILDSFRRSGEGDRDLLLAILGAKKAEEERLTALISTRLTILQARLSVHQTSLQLDAQAAAMQQGMLGSPSEMSAPLPERTPSLTSRGSDSSSAGPVSPALTASYTALYGREGREDEKPRAAPINASTRPFHLPPPRNLWRRHDSPSDEVETKRPYLPSMSTRKADGFEHSRRSVSPRGDGIDMLLDAGRRVSAERQ